MLADAPPFVAPSWQYLPPAASTAIADDAVDLAASAGLVLDAEQRLALQAMYGERRDGLWAAKEFALICARQNMKTAVLQAASLCDLLLLQQRLSVWTAHRFDTTEEAFRDLRVLVENNDHLRKRCKKPTIANGSEQLETLRGDRLVFRARSGSSGRGLSGDVVIMDEAFALSAAMMGALMPSISSRPNPQIRYASSAGMVTSDHLREIRRRGRGAADAAGEQDGPASRLAYLEWGGRVRPCARADCSHRWGEVTDCALDDRSLWQAANPAFGRRITAETIQDEREALPPGEFARERLGWWDEPGVDDDVIDLEVWDKLADPAGKIEPGPVGLAVDVTPDSTGVSCWVAGLRADGKAQVEQAERWDAPWREVDVVARVQRIDRSNGSRGVAIDTRGPANALVAPLEAAGVTVHRYSSTQCAAACGLFYNRATQDGMRHLGSPALSAALRGARKRDAGPDAWTWSRRGSAVDISSLVAATNALHLLVNLGQGPSVYESRGVLTL